MSDTQGHSPAVPLTAEEFQTLLDNPVFAPFLAADKPLAVALSGGPDSLALAFLLSGWAAARGGPDIHALIVDHGLRAESAEEAAQVAARVQGWAHLKPHILRWTDPAAVRLMEEARKARYDLMAQYCENNGIAALFVAHHQDDQAETVLLRLAGGSGLDGLGGMQAVQGLEGGLHILRPLLDVPKAQLVATCAAHNIACVQDPSNQNAEFARPRLRAASEVLAAEGLTPKRLSLTAKRLRRARNALDIYALQSFNSAVLESNTKQIVLNLDLLGQEPEDIILRVIMRAVSILKPARDYAPRMERIEAVVEDLIAPEPFRKRTLAGLIFSRDDGADGGTCTVTIRDEGT